MHQQRSINASHNHMAMAPQAAHAPAGPTAAPRLRGPRWRPGAHCAGRPARRARAAPRGPAGLRRWVGPGEGARLGEECSRLWQRRLGRPPCRAATCTCRRRGAPSQPPPRHTPTAFPPPPLPTWPVDVVQRHVDAALIGAYQFQQVVLGAAAVVRRLGALDRRHHLEQYLRYDSGGSAHQQARHGRCRQSSSKRGAAAKNRPGPQAQALQWRNRAGWGAGEARSAAPAWR